MKNAETKKPQTSPWPHHDVDTSAVTQRIPRFAFSDDEVTQTGSRK